MSRATSKATQARRSVAFQGFMASVLRPVETEIFADVEAARETWAQLMWALLSKRQKIDLALQYADHFDRSVRGHRQSERLANEIWNELQADVRFCLARCIQEWLRSESCAR